MENAVDIERVGVAPERRVDVEEGRAAARRPGAVEQEIDAAISLDPGGDRRVDGGAFGDVGGDRDRTLPRRRLLGAGASISAATTLAPSRAKIPAVARPMPLAAPVISTVLPRK